MTVEAPKVTLLVGRRSTIKASVTGVKKGTVTITVTTANGRKAKTKVKVE